MWRFVVTGLIFCVFVLLSIGGIIEYKPRGIPAQYKDGVLVLLYHDIVPDQSADRRNRGTVTTSQFREHLRALSDLHYQVISMSTFTEFILLGKEIPPNSIVITFDDGYESFYTQAYPLLQDFKMTATNFIIGQSSDFYQPKAIPHLSWNQMREMKRAGMEFYSHTYRLHNQVPVDRQLNCEPALTHAMYLETLGRLETEEEYAVRIRSDLSLMERRFAEELGNHAKLLAFPYGAYTDRVKKIAEGIGFQLFFTIKEGPNRQGNNEIYRVNAGEPEITAGDLLARLEALRY
ncbi:polysaccharide deacetylase family protein [Paenibacillus sp. FJAT-26967]|uniref:polysaccharide deacetylase family protein n=1 Tax=Paenibacillus sp. FJAT-26967 TaxID=1729690 RepID=UPI0008397FE8|nr:polysaccharide deacetylase family protein [Paenibacillus sp. FJAT-26967]